MRKGIVLILMMAWILCLSSCGWMPVTDGSLLPGPTSANDPKGATDMEPIWSLTDANDFVMAMAEHLDEKTQYGEDLSALSEAERVFYITQTLEMEVNNGGFSEFFYNSGGDVSHELVGAFTAIGADATAAICRKAIEAFGTDVPADRDERIEILDGPDGDRICEALEECDEAFFAYEEDLNALSYNYVMKNKEQFT